MSKMISMDEIFNIAVQIEHNAAGFYRRAAEQDKQHAELFGKLAAMENSHKEQFEILRAGLSSPDNRDGLLEPEGEMVLQAIASGYRLEGSPDASEEPDGTQSVADILRTGIELEKQAILFYLGLGSVVADKETQQTLDVIVGEEKRHLVTLSKELQNIDPA